MLDADRLVGLLAEPDRRLVVAALILAASDIDDLVTTTGLETRQVVDALDRLMAAGLVEPGSAGDYVILEAAFKAAARSTPRRNVVPTTGDVVERSIVGGKLVHLPRKRAKRLLVLDHLAQRFDPGTHYSEREVNQVLRAFDDDVATLRRYLVDEGFLDRAGGEYWRSGGTFPLEG
ncbi:MAG: DUF2087 domain-containing protein [Acidimicrobiales bacterium]